MGLLDFLKKETTPDKTDTNSVLSNDFTDPYQIEFHLEEIIKERGFISLKLDDHPAQYYTIFLRLEKGEEPGIFTDTMMPDQGNDLIMKSTKITFSYTFQGKHYDFKSKYLEMEKKEFTAFKIAIPQKIETVEHRQFVRVKPSLNEPVYVLSEEGDIEETVDISAGGLAFYTKRTIAEGKVYDKFIFTLPPGNRKIHTPAEVLRFIERAAPSRKDKNICCVEFTDMKHSQTEFLIKFVFQRMRQVIQEKLELSS